MPKFVRSRPKFLQLKHAEPFMPSCKEHIERGDSDVRLTAGKGQHVVVLHVAYLLMLSVARVCSVECGRMNMNINQMILKFHFEIYESFAEILMQL
jgi:hypothetical protein